MITLETANFHPKAGLKGCPAQLWQVQLWWRSQLRSFPRHFQRWRSTSHQSWMAMGHWGWHSWKWEIPWIHLGDAENGRCNDKEHVTIATMSWKNSFSTSDIFRQGTFAQCGQPSILWRLPGWLLRVQLPQSCKKTEPPHSLERNQGMIHRDPRISCAAAMAHLKSVQKSWWICATEKIGISMHSVPSTSKVPFLHVAINAQGHKD